jgi:hypothetical protein
MALARRRSSRCANSSKPNVDRRVGPICDRSGAASKRISD